MPASSSDLSRTPRYPPDSIACEASVVAIAFSGRSDSNVAKAMPGRTQGKKHGFKAFENLQSRTDLINLARRPSTNLDAVKT